MTNYLITAALAGILSKAGELLEGAHDSATQRFIVSEAKRLSDQVIQLGEPIKETTETKEKEQ